MIRLEGFSDVSEILQAGVYALVKRGVVIYVGKAKRLEARIATHRQQARKASRGATIPTWLPIKGFVFDQVFVRTCTIDQLDALEAEMINRYKPRFNESLKNGLKVKAPITLNFGNGIMVGLNSPPPAPVLVRRI